MAKEAFGKQRVTRLASVLSGVFAALWFRRSYLEFELGSIQVQPPEVADGT